MKGKRHEIDIHCLLLLPLTTHDSLLTPTATATNLLLVLRHLIFILGFFVEQVKLVFVDQIENVLAPMPVVRIAMLLDAMSPTLVVEMSEVE